MKGLKSRWSKTDFLSATLVWRRLETKVSKLSFMQDEGNYKLN